VPYQVRTLGSVQDESHFGRLLWTVLLTGVVVVVVLSFARQPLSGGDEETAGFGRAVTLWVAGGEAGGLAEAVAQQAAGCWASDGHTAQVGNLSGSSSAAVAGFLTRVHGAPEDLLVITSTTLSDIAHDRSVAAPLTEPREHAQVAAHLLADTAPIAVLGSDPLVLAVRAGSATRTDAELLAQIRQAASPALLGVASDTWLQDNLAALVHGAGLNRELPYTVFGSSREALVSLEAGEVEVVLAPANALGPRLRSGRLRALPWPSWSDGAPRAWVALVGPAGLSASAVATLRSQAGRLCAGADWTELLRGDGLSPARLSAARLGGFVRASVAETNRLQALAAHIVRGS
jgi:tripartite-type tricarboxylate transporter receptor subunit TctC